MEIYLVRHGVTDWNSQFKIQGDTDIPLNELGIQMAMQTAKALEDKGIVFDKVYSSPLDRAKKTAEILAKSTSIVTDERLKEMCFGQMEGACIKEMNGTNPFFEYFRKDCLTYDEEAAKSDDIETFSSVVKRASDFMKNVIESDVLAKEEKECRTAKGRDLRILISGHGALDQAILFYVKRTDSIAKFWKSGLLGNCSIAVIDYNPETGEYTMKEENMVLFDESLQKMVPKLLQ